MTNPALLQLDLSSWIQIQHPSPAVYPLSLSVTPSGYINLGDRLRREMLERSPELTFLFQTQPDRRIFILSPDPEGGYQFPKGGRIKDLLFSQSLVEAGIPLPARYQVAWNPQVNAWAACLISPTAKSPAVALTASLSPSRRRRKAAAHV